MTNIVEWLRGHPGEEKTVTEQFRNMVEQRHEAADEIERLTAECKTWHDCYDNERRECERLRAALQEIAEVAENNTVLIPAKVAEFARRALEPKP